MISEEGVEVLNGIYLEIIRLENGAQMTERIDYYLQKESLEGVSSVIDLNTIMHFLTYIKIGLVVAEINQTDSSGRILQDDQIDWGAVGYCAGLLGLSALAGAAAGCLAGLALTINPAGCLIGSLDGLVLLGTVLGGGAGLMICYATYYEGGGSGSEFDEVSCAGSVDLYGDCVMENEH